MTTVAKTEEKKKVAKKFKSKRRKTRKRKLTYKKEPFSLTDGFKKHLHAFSTPDTPEQIVKKMEREKQNKELRAKIRIKTIAAWMALKVWVPKVVSWFVVLVKALWKGKIPIVIGLVLGGAIYFLFVSPVLTIITLVCIVILTIIGYCSREKPKNLSNIPN